MKIKKVISIIPVVFMSISSAYAKGEIFYTVPFRNVEINAASKIYVDYDLSDRVLICKSPQQDEFITSVEWGYKDATRKIPLPVKLQDDPRVKDGYYADPHGRLVITNEFMGTISVSCDYQKI